MSTQLALLLMQSAQRRKTTDVLATVPAEAELSEEQKLAHREHEMRLLGLGKDPDAYTSRSLVWTGRELVRRSA